MLNTIEMENVIEVIEIFGEAELEYFVCRAHEYLETCFLEYKTIIFIFYFRH